MSSTRVVSEPSSSPATAAAGGRRWLLAAGVHDRYFEEDEDLPGYRQDYGGGVGYGVDLRPDGVWGKDGGDPGVLTIARYRPSTDTTAVFMANVDDDAVEDLVTLAHNLVNAALDA